MNPEILGVIVFICTFLCTFGIGIWVIALFSPENLKVKKRCESLTKNLQNGNLNEKVLAVLRKQKDWNRYPVFTEFPPLLNLPLLFEQSGLNSDVSRWLIMTTTFSGVAGFVLWIVTQNFIFALIGAMIVITLPYLSLLYKRKQRLSKFEANFAHALEILGRSLRAGHPFSMGLKMVSTELPDPVGTEFGQLFREQQMGLPIDESLRALVKRVPLMDLRFFVLTIMIHQQTGGDLAEVLDKLSNVIRQRFKILGQVKALTAEGRLSGWVLCLLPIFVFFMILTINPGYIKLLVETEIGKKMLYTAIVLQIFGVLVIRKIVNIKV